VAGELFARHTANVFAARTFSYAEVRQRWGLSSQMAQLAIKNACDAYRRDKSKRVHFRQHAAIVYDQRTMSFKSIDRVSLLTLQGRVVVPFVLGACHRERFALRKGQADLVLRPDGKWFLLVTVDLPDGTATPATEFLGLDLGIVNLAADSDGNAYSGEAVEKIRRRHKRSRQRYQRRGTKGAKKRLKAQRMKEGRFRRHHNHVISKAIVGLAKRTGRGIALENLAHIRARVTARGKDSRNRLAGWAFFQLRSFIEYKARLAGVAVLALDPRNSSRTCSACGHCAKGNRPSQDRFCCLQCGFSCNADFNAALVLRQWALGQLCHPAPELAGTSPSRKAAGL
jgi:putative transposase